MAYGLASQGRADGRDARIANVNDGEPNFNWNNRDNDNRNIRFRPAAVYYLKVKIEFSTHSIDQLKIRTNIIRVQILETLKNPDTVSESYRGRLLYRKQFGESILEVVAIKEDNKLVVITEYFLEQQ